MTTYTKYVTTIGLFVKLEQYEKRVHCKVWFGKKESGNWDAWIESDKTGGIVKKCGKLELTQEQMSELPEHPYDDCVFARAAFGLFNAEI
jgi:hypothetical protein